MKILGAMNKKLNFIFGALFSALLLPVGFSSFSKEVKADGYQCRASALPQTVAAISMPGDTGPKVELLG